MLIGFLLTQKHNLQNLYTMQTENELLAIAKKYGVPLPETCIELKGNINFYKSLNNLYPEIDLHPKTVYYWYRVKNTNKWFLDTDFTSEQTHGGYSPSDVEVLPAPQMHEIVVYLNFDVDKLGNTIGKLNIDSNGIGFECSTEIHDHHYAQAYAELYLKLKQQNLLCTK